MRAKLEWELTQAALGSPSFLHEGTDDGSLPTPCADATPSAVNLEQEARAAEAALLEVPRGKRPLSLWDWEIWTKARPAMTMTSYRPLFGGVDLQCFSPEPHRLTSSYKNRERHSCWFSARRAPQGLPTPALPSPTSRIAAHILPRTT